MSTKLKNLNPIISKLRGTPSIIGIKNIIDSYTPDHYCDILSEYKTLNVKEEYNQFGYHKYPLYTNTHWNIYIIKWNPNSKTPIHNHDEQGCLMKILDGSFTEYKYKYILSRFFPQTQLIEIEKYGPYYDKDLNNSFIVDYFHSIQNDSKTEGFSLHIYPNNNFKPNVIE